MASYHPDERSKGNRYNKRTLHDVDRIHTIVNEAPLLHVSFNDPSTSKPEFPAILPMLGALGKAPDDTDPHLYLHGSSAARMFKITANGPLALTVSATILDGYVLALTPFSNSCNYRSAVVFGYGTPVTQEAEKLWALELITENANPGRWANARQGFSTSEMTATTVLKVSIETASVKERVGGPGDEKKDLKNPEVVEKVWTGVVPTYLTFGEPVAGEANRVKEVPDYVREWAEDSNAMNEQRAVDAAVA